MKHHYLWPIFEIFSAQHNTQIKIQNELSLALSKSAKKLMENNNQYSSKITEKEKVYFTKVNTVLVQK
jgi:hypothetical protein